MTTYAASELIQVQQTIRELLRKMDSKKDIDISEEAYKNTILEQWQEFVLWVQRLPPPENAPPEPNEEYWKNKLVMKGYRKKLLEVQFINNDVWNQIVVTMKYLVPNLKRYFKLGSLDNDLKIVIKNKEKLYGKFASDQQAKLNSILYRKKELAHEKVMER